MSSRAPEHHRNPHWRQRSKKTVSLVLATLFLFALTQIPYQIIREERIRAFGEARTTATIEAQFTDATGENKKHLITYAYMGPDGRTRRRTANLPMDAWTSAVPGKGIVVYYAKSQPNLSRARGETEDPFRIWLRETVRGNELPENESSE